MKHSSQDRDYGRSETVQRPGVLKVEQSLPRRESIASVDPILELRPSHELIAKDGVIWTVERSHCQSDEVEKVTQQPELAVRPDHEWLQVIHNVLDSQVLKRLLHSR